MEDQPLPADASPTALSPGYVVDSDPEKDGKDPKEDPADYPTDIENNDDDESSNDDDDDDDKDEKDPKEDPAYYHADRGNNEDDESSNDDDDDNDVEKDKEKEEHLAPADPSMYLQMILSPQAENTEAFETDESASTPSTIFTTTT
nr:hypothetical protein [Tanacetum cinerariifolium]